MLILGLAFGMPIASVLVAMLIVFDKLTPAARSLRAVPRQVNKARGDFYSDRTTKDVSGLKVRGGRSMEAASAVSYLAIAAVLFVIAWLFRIEAA